MSKGFIRQRLDVMFYLVFVKFLKPFPLLLSYPFVKGFEFFFIKKTTLFILDLFFLFTFCDNHDNVLFSKKYIYFKKYVFQLNYDVVPINFSCYFWEKCCKNTHFLFFQFLFKILHLALILKLNFESKLTYNIGMEYIYML